MGKQITFMRTFIVVVVVTVIFVGLKIEMNPSNQDVSYKDKRSCNLVSWKNIHSLPLTKGLEGVCI